MAIVVGDLKIFYASVTETGADKSSNATTGFSNVKDATSVEAFSMTDLSAYIARPSEEIVLVNGRDDLSRTARRMYLT
ncbi:MAG: hypothetical protein IKQ25_03095 [Lachnospiraceae bacterium]|nr:hypothetical protein [Lachnospiraceae bacterium]